MQNCEIYFSPLIYTARRCFRRFNIILINYACSLTILINLIAGREMTVDATDVDKANAPGLDRIGEWVEGWCDVGAPG